MACFICLQAPINLSKEADVQPDWDRSVIWQLTTQAGPQFAALNGDINFIHLHPIIARVFGFKSNIAHGTYLLAKAIAAIQQGKSFSSLHADLTAQQHALSSLALTNCVFRGIAPCLFCSHVWILQILRRCTLRLCQPRSSDQQYCLMASHAAGSEPVQVVQNLLSAPAVPAKLSSLDSMSTEQLRQQKFSKQGPQAHVLQTHTSAHHEVLLTVGLSELRVYGQNIMHHKL